MALSFSEGSIGGDIERVPLGALQSLLWRRATARRCALAECNGDRGTAGLEWHRDRTIEHAQSPRAAAHQPAHLVLLPLRAAGHERRGPERLWRGRPGASSSSTRASTSGSAGCTPRAASTLSICLPRPSSRRTVGAFYRYGAELRPVTVSPSRVPYRTADGRHARSGPSRSIARITARSSRERDGKWIAIALMQKPVEALSSPSC